MRCPYRYPARRARIAQRTDLDLNGRFLRVERNLYRGTISATKNGKDRRVDMSGQLTETLDVMLSKRRAEALRREMKKPAEERRDAATIVNEVMGDWLFSDSGNHRKIKETIAIG